jgi:hypothetical protein
MGATNTSDQSKLSEEEIAKAVARHNRHHAHSQGSAKAANKGR